MRHLDLAANNVRGAGLLALGESPHAVSLEALDLDENNALGPKPLAAFLRSPLASRLRWLRLGERHLSVASKVLTAHPLERLRELRPGRSGDWQEMVRLRAKMPWCAIG
jgi:hypothetical protein